MDNASLPEARWQGRYQLQQTLAEHPESATYRVQNAAGQSQILKELRLAGLSDWKRLELFEREARTLRHLDHSGLPKLLDFFRDADNTRLCLVLEEMPGRSLLEWLAEGWRPTEGEVKDIAVQSLELLAYLHGRQPPIIHRDLKPSNILREAHGRVSLIDLGAAQHLLHPEGGRTVVGTFGYMPPEQFSGQAGSASDLYALAASLVHLLSGRSPAELPLDGLRLRFGPYVMISPEFERWLSVMLDPDPKQRYASAAEALAALQNPETSKTVRTEADSLPETPRKIRGLGVAFVGVLVILGHQAYTHWYAPAGSQNDTHQISRPSQTGQADNQTCFNAPLLQAEPQIGPEAEAFRADFAKRFPLPPELSKLVVPPVTTLDELNTLWRCPKNRSQADPVFFKTAWQLIQHSPLDEVLVAESIYLMQGTQPHYPQREALLAFAVENYHDLKTPSDWDHAARVAAGLVLDYSQWLNRQGNFESAKPWLQYMLSERADEINDHQLQLLSYEYAYALYKSGESTQALTVLDHALQQYKQGSWNEKLQKLRAQIAD